jgi:hypothetical protein
LVEARAASLPNNFGADLKKATTCLPEFALFCRTDDVTPVLPPEYNLFHFNITLSSTLVNDSLACLVDTDSHPPGLSTPATVSMRSALAAIQAVLRIQRLVTCPLFVAPVVLSS